VEQEATMTDSNKDLTPEQQALAEQLKKDVANIVEVRPRVLETRM
jgi:hypothetical protein